MCWRPGPGTGASGAFGSHRAGSVRRGGQVAVDDNQRVRRGDVLYRIDPRRFELAVEQARAHLVVAEETLRQRARRRGAGRARRHRAPGGHPARGAHRGHRPGRVARRAGGAGVRRGWTWSAACCARSTVTSPICACAGATPWPQAGRDDLDGGSFWITGYFEETKLRRIQPGAPARIRLMGFESPLTGRVASIAAASPTKTTAWAITACRRSIRVSAGCGWRSDSRAHRDRAGARGRAARRRHDAAWTWASRGNRAWRAACSDWLAMRGDGR